MRRSPAGFISTCDSRGRLTPCVNCSLLRTVSDCFVAPLRPVLKECSHGNNAFFYTPHAQWKQTCSPAPLAFVAKFYPKLAPNILPAAAVAAMASAPQKVTRTAPRTFPAPPADAPKLPRTLSATSVETATTSVVCAGGDKRATIRGTTAPAAKVKAETTAA